MLLHRVLAGAGYDVTSLASASEALVTLERHGRFDLYVLDVQMPTLRGTELATRIRQVDADARILFFTAYASSLFGPREAISQDEVVLQKPASNRELRDVVSLMLFGHTRGPRA